MPERIKQKWRPPLALVIGGTLAAVLAMPMIGIGYFKVAGFILGWGETTLMIFVIALILTVILGYLLWRLVLRPVYALTAHANAVKDGRTDAPLPPHFGTPEITALGQAVLDMGTTLQDREAGMRAYTNHVTHELRSPLTSLIGAAELMDNDTAPEDRAQLISTIREAAQKMQGQLDALRRLAMARDPVGRGPALLSRAIEGVDQPGLTISFRADATLPIDENALGAILGHLAQNAAAHGADHLDVRGFKQGFSVSDNGRGIAAGNRDRIFDPFFTTRRASGGTGMGLAVVRTMLQAAGGKIELLPDDNGAAFHISFT